MAQTPDPAAVRKAIEDSKPGADGRVLKVLYLDEQGEKVGEYAPTQLPENPWDGVGAATAKVLVDPPYNLSQLVFLAEMHPVHSSALDQKVADVCGSGWEWEPEDEDGADEDIRDEMEDWFQSLSPDEYDMREVIEALWHDYETTGWCMFECARAPDGSVKRVYHVPAHTVKCHKNGFALCQVRDSRKVWFRRWGAEDINGKRVEVNIKTGSITNVPKGQEASDLFVIRKPTRRSSYYGIPGYVSALGWITLALAARDDNLYYFSNRREPRWAIILLGMAENTEIEEDLRRAFAVDMRTPYRNVIVPVSGKDADIKFQEMSGTTKNDGSFGNLEERSNKAVMIGHRVPAERLANSEVGALGGNIASEANRVYKESVNGPSQELLNNRLNRFISIEYPKSQGKDEPAPGDKPVWMLKMADLDIRTDREDLDQALMMFHGDMATLREARARIGMGPLMVPKKVPKEDANGNPVLDPMTGAPVMVLPSENQESPNYNADGSAKETDEVESEYNDKLFTELPGASGQAGLPGGAPPPGAGKLTEETNKARHLETEVYKLLRASHETHERLLNAADEVENRAARMRVPDVR